MEWRGDKMKKHGNDNVERHERWWKHGTNIMEIVKISKEEM